ncbi:MAG: alpha-amylase [Anaerolineae bacterium]|nr:alpha-amylase [Anaerolineae bacterium]
MSEDTLRSHRNLVFYEVYVRDHGPSGAFADVEADLPRIRALGVDVVWFMPIHPIGVLNKKGTLGCPYSIADYRDINPEYGARADFSRLIDRAHALGLKVMIDVVYNHTAHDSLLVREHPQWFHQDADGRPVTTVPDWSDVIDLNHPNPELTAYLIETLQMWSRAGVDGFRCDVASLLPLDFWMRARAAVAEINPDTIWLAESVHAEWVARRRADGLRAISDGELYHAFDVTYDYDIWSIWEAAVDGKAPVSRYLEALRFQDSIYPNTFVKLRCVENHDQPRVMERAASSKQALAWTAFAAFNKGAFLIYAGQESGATHKPSHFDREPITWGEYALSPFLTRLAHLKKDPAQVEGQFTVFEADPAIQALWAYPQGSLLGVFNVEARSGDVKMSLPDGDYPDVLHDQTVAVRGGAMPLPETAVILRTTVAPKVRPLYSLLLDYPK